MTDTQREQILSLRAEGLGYVRIAKEMGLSENTVKSFCRRSAKAEAAEKPVMAVQGDTDKCFCKQCGIEVKQTSGRKVKKFCSDQCRMKWWNAHPEQINRQTMHYYKCPCCGREFAVYGNTHRKYCSHECYINARFNGGTYHD